MKRTLKKEATWPENMDSVQLLSLIGPNVSVMVAWA